MKKLILKIPEPCHEDWNKMTPKDKGRHCKACDKIVIDFTKMSNDEIVQTIKESSKNVCGHIKKSQLNINLVDYHYQNIPISLIPTNPYLKLLKVAAAALILVTTSCTNGKVRSEEKEHSVEKVHRTQELIGDTVIVTSKDDTIKYLNDEAIDGGLQVIETPDSSADVKKNCTKDENHVKGKVAIEDEDLLEVGEIEPEID